MATAFRLKEDSRIEPEAKAGTIVYRFAGCDYGLASDDTRFTGIEHMSVTLKACGGYPSFTAPVTALEPIEVEPLPPPDEEHVNNVCRPGQGAATCRYLTMSTKGWSCEKLAVGAMTIDDRVERGDFTAKGDNCEGRGSR